MAKKAKMSKAKAAARGTKAKATRIKNDTRIAKSVGVRGGARGAVKESGKTARAITRDYRAAERAGLSGAERASAAMSSGKSG